MPDLPRRTHALDPHGGRRPMRDEAIQAAGAVLARVLADADAKSPRQAAEDACRGRRDADVDHVENLIRAERGLPPRDRSPEPGENRGGSATPRTWRRARSTAQPASLAVTAGMSREEKLALAEAIRAECG